MRAHTALAAAALAMLPAPAAANHRMDVGVRVLPPVGYEYARLTCGWHRSCRSPYPDGTGLDWGVSDDGRRVWFRVRATSSAATEDYGVLVAWVRLDHHFYGPCNEVLARINNNWDDRFMAAVRFQHTYRGSYRKAEVFGGTEGRLTAVTAGTMVEEDSDCPWSGYHAHSWHTDGETQVVRNSAVPGAPSSRTYQEPKSLYERRMSWTDYVP